MELISTDNGASTKKTLSVFSGIASAFGGLIAGIWAVGLIAHILGGLNVWMAIAVVPLGICFGVGIGYVFYRGWLFPSSFYVDRVYDCGDYVLVEIDGRQVSIGFDEIIDISYSYVSPMRITLAVKGSGEARPPINFCPRNALEMPGLVRSLRERIVNG